jgi:FtsZ-binding cell division protein ZapB
VDDRISNLLARVEELGTLNDQLVHENDSLQETVSDLETRLADAQEKLRLWERAAPLMGFDEEDLRELAAAL